LLKQKKSIVELESKNERLLSSVSELQDEVRDLTIQLDELSKSEKRTNRNPIISKE